MIVALGTIADAQSKETEHTAKAVAKLINYSDTHLDETFFYRASDMVIYNHRNASYISEPRACSQVDGHYFLSDWPLDPTKYLIGLPTLNGPIHTIY